MLVSPRKVGFPIVIEFRSSTRAFREIAMTMKSACPLLLQSVLLLIFAASPSTAQVYKTLDKTGKVTYTDNPAAEEKSEEVDISKTNTQPPIKKIKIRPTPPKASPEAPEFNLKIESPKEGAKIGAAAGSIPVSFSTSLQIKNHQIKVTMGSSSILLPKGANSGALPISKTTRGKQTISAQIIHSTGTVIDTAPPVSVYIIRPGGKR